MAAERRRTKIVATIGPASRSVDAMTELIRAGADVFRLNFSHGTREDHAENVARAREAAERADKAAYADAVSTYAGLGQEELRTAALDLLAGRVPLV